MFWNYVGCNIIIVDQRCRGSQQRSPINSGNHAQEQLDSLKMVKSSGVPISTAVFITVLH